MKKISLAIATIGIFTILLTINFIELKPTPIEKIDKSYLDKKIKVIATTDKITVTNSNFTIINLQNTTLTIICNCPQTPKNKTLEITGRVTTYNNKLQIQADKIKLFKSP